MFDMPSIHRVDRWDYGGGTGQSVALADKDAQGVAGRAAEPLPVGVGERWA